LQCLQNDNSHLQKLVEEATKLAVVISILVFKSDNPGGQRPEDWLEQILGNMAELDPPSIRYDNPLTFSYPSILGSIRRFIENHVVKSVLLQVIDIGKVKKYQETLAGMRDLILVGAPQ